jgi:uncharacterized protein (TIGR03118 family)
VPTLGGALWLAAQPAAAQPNRFRQHNLVSDIPGLADNTDPQLSNPWGISFGPTTPFWVSDANTGVTTLYNGAGVKQGLVVTIPGPGGTVPGVPTGQVFNGTTGFALANGNPARFIFASATGTISGWNGGTTASTQVNQFPNSSFTGLAIGTTGGNPFLYAANFGAGQISVFDGSFAPTTLAGSFNDPTLPANYSPFNVQNIGGQLFVSYALVDPDDPGEEVAGPGNGIVNVFDLNGNFVRRLTTGGALNAPWGFAMAPSNFGAFGGDLLVGNLGDGTINAYDPTTGAFHGTLLNQFGTPLINEGLWGLAFGNNGPGFDPNKLYFAAGIEDETHGLFGSISPVPEPSTVLLTATGLGALLVTARRRRKG